MDTLIPPQDDILNGVENKPFNPERIIFSAYNGHTEFDQRFKESNNGPSYHNYDHVAGFGQFTEKVF